MVETTNTIKVSIAKLGTSIQEVELTLGSNVMQALRKAGFNLDSVISVKRNGIVVEMDDELSNEDVLLVSLEKIKGWADETAEEPTLIRLAFDITRESQASKTNKMAFTSDMSTFAIVKEVLTNKGYSLNDFKELKDEATNETIGFGDKLVDNGSYKIIICDKQNCGECDEDDEY